MPSAPARRRFLPWDRPLLPQVVALLAEGWSGHGPLDLRDLLVIVPTRQSGRRLREALAGYAAERGSAVFPPRVVQPESLLSSDDADRVATRLDTLLAWSVVLRTVPFDTVRAVFPSDPPRRDFVWSLGLAEQFIAVQRTLAESGLRLATIEPRLGADAPERERWQQLGELERAVDAELARHGRCAAPASRIARATNPELPADVKRVLVIAAPDPQPLVLTALAKVAESRPLEIAVFAPEELADVFDAWGRPQTETWRNRIIELPAFEKRVHVCADATAQASRVAQWAGGYGTPEGKLALGIAAPELVPLVAHELSVRRVASFNPEGEPRRRDGLFPLLQALARFAADDSFAAAAALARCPDVLAFLGTRLGPTFSAAQFLRTLDDLHTRHLPASLAEAQRHLAVAVKPEAKAAEHAVQQLDLLRSTLRTGAFPANATAALVTLFAERRFVPAEPLDAMAVEAAASWSSLLREIADRVSQQSAISTADWWELALRLHGESVRYDDKVSGALELQGWLELLWEDAPHLAVVGLNDGAVPDSVLGDPFLPESLRLRLGLKTNAARFARDAYLLQALAASRKHGGRLDLLFGKTSVSGEPLRPSRLLLRCPDEELPRRVNALFRPVDSAAPAPAWRRAWQLHPRVVSPPERIAVTSFRAWLACPFRFYLSRVLRMQPVDPAKTELDVFDFGTLCHAALEAMGRAPHLRDCVDAAILREFLTQQLEREARQRFGRDLTLPLVVQLESARQRLARAAEVQAAIRAEGWVIIDVEHPFELRVGDLTVTGKIDRIDRHEHTGAIRVLDYKTSDRPVTPAQAHLRSARREEDAPEFARWTENGRELVWTELQLPLYLRAVAADPALAGGSEVAASCAYFNLPKAISETALLEWQDFTHDCDEAAWRCAEGVAQAIRAGEFWPPNERIAAEADDFAPLFHHGVADSVAWEGALSP